MVLALVLAFACAFTMFAGAASFTDEADIQAKDAVNMLTALGVIEGYEDGSFQPDGTVTRAEMAKMIFVVRNNSIDDSAYKNISSKMTDIKGHWAEGYIKFCESQGIIAGKGNNKFDPDATVTGTEAAKMLLVVAGYDADKANLTGSAWETNTLKYAGAAGILDNVGSGLSAGLPRQYAAQMIYNALDTNRVKWSTDSNSFDDILNGGVKETVGAAYMGLVYDVGSLISVDKDSLTIALNDSYKADNYHKTLGATVGFTKVGTDYSDLLGQTVKVMFKDGKTNTVLGVFAVSDNTAVTINKSAVDYDVRKLDLDGTKYSVDSSGINVYKTNGDTTVYATASAAKEKDNAKTANVMTFIDANGDGNIETAIEKVIDVKKVTSVSSSSIVAGGKTYRFDDHNIDEDVEKNDWVAITNNLYDDCMDIYVVDQVSGKIDGVKANETRIDGTWYWNSADLDDSDVKAGNTVDAYVLNGVVFSVDKTSGTAGMPDVAMVISKGTGYNADQIYMLFTDGSKKRVEYEIEDGDTLDEAELVKGAMVEFSVSGDTYTLKKLIDGDEYGDYNYEANESATGTKVENIGGYKVDDSAKIFLYDDDTDSSKVITGKQLKSVALSSITSTGINYFYSKVNGLDRASIAAIEYTGNWSDTDNFETNDNYGYITSNAYTSSSGYITFGLWTGDEQVTVTFKSSKPGDFTKGTVIGYSSINEGEIEDVSVINVTAGAMTGANNSGSTVTLGDNNGAALSEYDVDSDTVVLFVNSSADEAEMGVTGSNSDLRGYAADDTADVYFTNALWNGATDGLNVLVVDTTGKFDTDVVAKMKGVVNTIATTLSISSGSVEDREGNVLGNGASVLIGDTIQVTAGNSALTLSNCKTEGGLTTVAANTTVTVVITGTTPSIS